VVRDWLGDDGLVADPEPVTASEDFAFFLEKVPGCYINIGNGVGSVGGCMVHNRRLRLQRPCCPPAPPTG
jgi:hippurate hydrolase